MAGTEMRKLPAFLEDVAQRWRFQFVSLSDVDAVFGDEVMLCDTSLAMWQDESEPKSDVFWGTFNRLAAALRHHHADVR
jgi:hypothetical protein